jgi:hypothetical protein
MRVGGNLMTQSSGYVTTQSLAFKYGIAFEPYRYTCYLKQVKAGLPDTKINFSRHFVALKVKNFQT